MLLTTAYGQIMQQLGKVGRPFISKMKLGFNRNETFDWVDSTVALNVIETTTTQASTNETTIAPKEKSNSTKFLETTTIPAQPISMSNSTTA